MPDYIIFVARLAIWRRGELPCNAAGDRSANGEILGEVRLDAADDRSDSWPRLSPNHSNGKTIVSTALFPASQQEFHRQTETK